MKKRFKWEPPALMILVLLLGAWLVLAGKNRLTGIEPAPGSRTAEFRLGNDRGVVEVTPIKSADDPYRFRILLRNGFASEPLTSAAFKSHYGDRAYAEVITQGDNALFRLLNITSWAGLAWVVFGFAGQLAFSGRMILQWLVSEKERKSVVPAAFWWLSLIGGAIMFTYFVWRQDLVGVLGQSSGLVIYARNIRLIYKHKRRDAEQAPPDPAVS
jgi:lipid-A-disaccharide synthase-like uncharacterized protein